MAKKKLIDEDEIKIYYFHGFGSGLNSSTAKALKKAYPQLKVLTYDTMNYDNAEKQFQEYFKNKRWL